MIEPKLDQPRLNWDNRRAELSLPDGLSLQFNRHDDRWSHRVHCPTVDREMSDIALLHSIEGNGDQPWPPAPPLQSLDCTYINESPVLFAVGQAGQGHWSASVSLRTLEKDGLNRIEKSESSQATVPPTNQSLTQWAIEIEIAWFGKGTALGQAEAVEQRSPDGPCSPDQPISDSSGFNNFQSTYELGESINWKPCDAKIAEGALMAIAKPEAVSSASLVIEPFADATRRTEWRCDERRLILFPSIGESPTFLSTDKKQTSTQVRWGYRLYLQPQ